MLGCRCSWQHYSITAKRWKQPRGPSTGAGINKIYINGVSVIKRNGVLMHFTMWMNPENMMLHEINQTYKNKYCTIPLA